MAHRDQASHLSSDKTIFWRKPRITQEMRAQAKANPDSWLYVVDDAFDPHGRLPSWAVVGVFPVDANGMIIDNFYPNERYRPSPKTLGFPEPTSDLERILQLVHARHRPTSDVAPAVLNAEIHVYAFSANQRSVIGFHNNDGEVVVPAYTSKSFTPSHWPYVRSVLGRDIVDLLADKPLMLNPHDSTLTVIPAEELRYERKHLLD